MRISDWSSDVCSSDLANAYAVEKQRVILSHPGYAVWLLECDGTAIGHAAAGPCGLPHPDVAPGDGELKRLYLLREHQNGGWGGKLFATALDWLQRDGPRTLWIGVWSEHVGAQRFYARHGFTKVGEYEFPVGRVARKSVGLGSSVSVRVGLDGGRIIQK